MHPRGGIVYLYPFPVFSRRLGRRKSSHSTTLSGHSRAKHWDATSLEPRRAWNFARPIRESTVSREMTRRYMSEMLDYAETDVCLEAVCPICVDLL